MRTLDEQNTESFSIFARAERNLKLLWRIVSMATDYFRTGGAIRRRYRAKQRRGKIYYVDEAD